MVERKGRVKAKLAGKFEMKSVDMKDMLRGGVDLENSVLITDEYRSDAGMSDLLSHKRIKHSQPLADCLVVAVHDPI